MTVRPVRRPGVRKPFVSAAGRPRSASTNSPSKPRSSGAPSRTPRPQPQPRVARKRHHSRSLSRPASGISLPQLENFGLDVVPARLRRAGRDRIEQFPGSHPGFRTKSLVERPRGHDGRWWSSPVRMSWRRLETSCGLSALLSFVRNSLISSAPGAGRRLSGELARVACVVPGRRGIW